MLTSLFGDQIKLFDFQDRLGLLSILTILFETSLLYFLVLPLPYLLSFFHLFPDDRQCSPLWQSLICPSGCRNLLPVLRYKIFIKSVNGTLIDKTIIHDD